MKRIITIILALVAFASGMKVMAADESYAVYNSGALLFYHDSQRSSKTGTTYFWFTGMNNLQSIGGIDNLNTSNVTNMHGMFQGCGKLTSRQSQVTSNAWYTLDGRVVKTPLKGQLYIRGGNKVINTN